MLSVNCPKCGASTKFDETKQVPTFCIFCGAHFPDMTNFVKESLRINQDKEQLDIDKQRHQMTMEEMQTDIQRETVRQRIPLFNKIAVVFAILLVVAMWIYIFSRK